MKPDLAVKFKKNGYKTQAILLNTAEPHCAHIRV